MFHYIRRVIVPFIAHGIRERHRVWPIFFMRTDPVSFSTVGVGLQVGYEIMPLKGV